MKKSIKKRASKATAYVWGYLKMTNLFPDFKKKRKKDVRNGHDN